MKQIRPWCVLAMAWFCSGSTFASAMWTPAQEVATPESSEVPSAELAKPAEPEAFAGSLEAGLAELRRVATEGNLAQAEDFSQELLAPTRGDRAGLWLDKKLGRFGPRGVHFGRGLLGFLGLTTRGPGEQAVVHYDLGLLQAQEQASEQAAESFRTAVMLAPGEVRKRGTYNLGVLDLDNAELLFDKIPEVHGRTRSAMSPGFVPGQAKGNEEEPDYLAMAKASYQSALVHFTERLKLDWRDADTRANVEWIQRRMDELRKVEEKRKSDEGQGMEQDDPEAGDQEPEEEEQQDQSGDKGAQSDQPEETPEDQQKQQDKEKQEGEQDQENQENSEQEQPEEEPEESEQRDKESESKNPGEEKPEERLLTAEEIKRLLKRLEAHDKEGERLRDLVRPRQQKRVKKDW